MGMPAGLFWTVRNLIRAGFGLILAVGATLSIVAAGIWPSASSAIAAGTLEPMGAPVIGDSCLVGRWVEVGESAPGNWTWNGEVIAVSGLAGQVVTYAADGTATYDLSGSQPLIGDSHGHQVEIVIRGSVSLTVRADGGNIVESNIRGSPTVAFYYDGVVQPGGTVSFQPGTRTYSCDAGNLHSESAALHAGYGPQVDDLVRITPIAAPSPVVSPSGPTVVSSVGSTLATPTNLLRAPVALLANALIALALVLLVTFPSHLFNRTYEENHDAIRAWWERRLPQLKRLRLGTAIVPAPGRASLSYVIVVLCGGVLAALLDPSFGPNLRTLALFLGVVLALIAGSTLGATADGLYRAARHKAGIWHLHALPSGLVVAALCVLVSRLTSFQPGYLYGLIGGVTFARSLSLREEGHVVAVTSVLTLAVSVAAWLVWVPVSGASAADPTGFGWALLSNFLAAVFVSGMVGLVIGLVPLRFMPGEKLANWNRGAWGAVFGIASLAVIEIMLRPQSTGARPASVPFWTTVALFLAFGAASVLFWGYFRMRRRAVSAGRARAVPPSMEARGK